tara:strand:+ start:13163 stop:13636 length:474 start_codon:yes stop_codon:yes gene_type:complete
MIDIASIWLLPEWLPNAHLPLVYFPIALLTAGVLFDGLGFALRQQIAWRHGSTALYVIGTMLMGASYVTGQETAATVFPPGLAHGLVNKHWSWATWTLSYFVILTPGRLAMHIRSSSTNPSTSTRDYPTLRLSWSPLTIRIVFLLAGIAGIWLVKET